jgi:multidrug efflux pump
MNISAFFIHRPVGTSLLTLAIALAGGLAYFFLPVSPMPQIDFPTIYVSASLPGASPETVASSIVTPLERQFGHIAGVSEMTSSSGQTSGNITLQFDLSRNVDAAARDVQAAINDALSNLPSNLPSRPTWRKYNPGDAPIMILSLTSEIYSRGRMYDIANSILMQKISQVEGVGQVTIGGSALPAVRVDVNPTALNNIGLSMDDVRNTIANANSNRPKGRLSNDRHTWSIEVNDQLLSAQEYLPLLVAYKNGAPVRLSDVATVTDSVEDLRQSGLANGKPAVSVVIFRQPGANIIATVDRIRALLPTLQASVPPAIEVRVTMDRTPTIRGSIADIQITLLLSVVLVVLVVFVFLRNPRVTLIPSVAVPVSLIGTCGVMYLVGYSIDNLSLMALTIATGFVVDDAIVVLENITRYHEKGMPVLQAALRGAREIGFTVMSISISLVAVFIPILFMGGLIGRLFREFAVTLSVAIGVSMVISLTTTPMMCAILLKDDDRHQRHGWLYRMSEAGFDFIQRTYGAILGWVMRNSLLMLIVTALTLFFTVYLFTVVPRGLLPQQDTGRMSGSLIADQSNSFYETQRLMTQYAAIIAQEPAIDMFSAFTSGSNSGRVFATLKPRSETGLTTDEVIARLRPKLASVAGASLFFNNTQDIRVGGHSSSAQYQYVLKGDSFQELAVWAPKMLEKMRTLPGVVDANSDQQNQGLESRLTIDRTAMARLGVTTQQMNQTLNDSFGQRQVSTLYLPLNQYHVVMEVDPQFAQSPEALRNVYLSNTAGRTPLETVVSHSLQTTPLGITHQGLFPAITLSFNLKPGFALGDAITEIEQAGHDLGLPANIRGSFAGTALAYQDSQSTLPLLILTALAAVYIVLGVLYESYIHPITILFTLPSAIVGALLALIISGTDLNLISAIGLFLLIGIVKKNAIMMIDFALELERSEKKAPADAIYEAALTRFRPIMMTTMAALFGGLPLALGNGMGAELRRPLGIAIVGGLILSQALTLFTTPVIYLFMEHLRLWSKRFFARFRRHLPTDKPAH